MKNTIPPIKIETDMADYLNSLKKKSINISEYIRNLIRADMKKNK